MYRLILGDGLTCVAPKRVFLSSHSAPKNVILLKGHCTIDLWETGTEIDEGERERNYLFPIFPRAHILCASSVNI